MGQMTDARIRAFQERAGIEPATGQRAARLSNMSKRAYDLIQVIALEQAGIRDGDGQWHGCAPIASIIGELGELEREDRVAWSAASSPQPSDADPGGPPWGVS